MKAVFVLVSLAMLALALTFPAKKVAADSENVQLIAVTSQLSGLAANAVFPFIDTTPNHIVRAHVAITDATSQCSAGGPAPANITVLVGDAGAVPPNLVPVNFHNLGIGSIAQCVFHQTITAGKDGIPDTVTDIVVVNGNKSAALTGINTVTASATVRASQGE